jgi:WD40 repeat protein
MDTATAIDMGAADAPMVPQLPPSLTKCKVFDHGPMECGPNLSPYQSVFAAFSPDGKRVVTSGVDDGIKFWNVQGGDLVVDVQRLTATGIARVAYSPDGTLLAVGADKGQLFLFDFTQNTQQPLMGHTERVRSIGFSKDGAQLYSVDVAGNLRAWTVATRQPLGAPITVPGQPWALAVAQTNPPGQSWIAVSTGVAEGAAMDAGGGLGKGAHVFLVNAQDPTKSAVLDIDTETGAGDTIAVALSPDGKLLAAGATASVVTVWDVTNPMAATKAFEVPVAELQNGNRQESTALGFSPDSRYLVAGYGGFYLGSRLRVVDVTTKQVRNDLMPEIWGVFSTAFSPAGDAVVVGADNCNKVLFCRD